MIARKPTRKPTRKRDEIARERKLRPRMRRLQSVLRTLSSIVALSLTYLFFSQGYALASWYIVRGGFIDITSHFGINVQNIYISGTKRITADNVLVDIPQSMAIPPIYITSESMPLYGISLTKLRSRLQDNSWVKHASIRRQLPDTLHIDIVERTPTVIWADGNSRYLADETGALITTVEGNEDPFILIDGGVPQQDIPELLAMFTATPAIIESIDYAVRISDRRWNIVLTDGLVIKLPEANHVKAWQQLGEMHHNTRLLDRAIIAVDLRDPTRMYLELKKGAKISR